MSDESSHLLDLRDPRQAGVYRVMRADVAPLLALANAEHLAVHEIDLQGVEGKPELIERIHDALGFPHGWGRNWDALADGLNDLSWLGDAGPRVLVWRGLDDLHRLLPDLESTLVGVLEDVSAAWGDDGIALWSLICLTRIPDDEPGASTDTTRH